MPTPPGFPTASPFCSDELTIPFGGAAYVFEQGADDQWSHVAAFIPRPGTPTDFQSGSLAVSGDGGTLAMHNSEWQDGSEVRQVVID